MGLWCSCIVFSLFCFLIVCYSEDVLSQLNGNISVLSQHLGITTVVLKDGNTIRYPANFQISEPNLRLPCHTCDPSYNIFQINNQYLVPNHSKIHVLSHNHGYTIDIGDCDPLTLHSGRLGVIWVYCAVHDSFVDIVELRVGTNGTWYKVLDTEYGVWTDSASVSRNSLLSIRDKAGQNITYIYFTDGGYLLRRGLEDLSLQKLRLPSILCDDIQNLFFVSEEMVMFHCILKRSPGNTGLVLFNSSWPSAIPKLFQDLGDLSGVVYISDGIVVLLMSKIVVIRNAISTIKLEQVIGLHSQLSSQGLFVQIHRTTYFVCTSRNAVYFIDIATALDGNNTAYLKIESQNEICIEKECVMQYMSGILFVPLKMSEKPDGLALYYMDPIGQIATIYAVTPYRYFFTLERPWSTISLPTEQGFKDDSPKQQNAGRIAGSVVGALVAAILIGMVIIISITYMCYKKKTQYYYQYQTAEVRFDNEDDSIEIVPGRINIPIWYTSDDRSTEATPPSALNNQTGKKMTATNATLKEKNTNVEGNNARHSVNDDEGCYGVETREDQISLKEYIDCLVVGTLEH